MEHTPHAVPASYVKHDMAVVHMPLHNMLYVHAMQLWSDNNHYVNYQVSR